MMENKSNEKKYKSRIEKYSKNCRSTIILTNDYKVEGKHLKFITDKLIFETTRSLKSDTVSVKDIESISVYLGSNLLEAVGLGFLGGYGLMAVIKSEGSSSVLPYVLTISSILG